MAVTATSLSDRLREMADRLDAEIERKRAPRLENTPKRQREGMSARIDAARLERTQQGLRAIADAHDRGAVPPALAGVKTKAAVFDLVATRIVSNGYYHVGDTGEWNNSSPAAVALKALIEGAKSESDLAAEAERKRRESIIALENEVKFSNIDGFFPTPPDVIAQMIDLADLRDGMNVLEPSAGKGDIADALAALPLDLTVRCVERNHTLCRILAAKGHVYGEPSDFLELEAGCYQRVLMNPPFERGQDAVHVRRAFDWLVAGGRLVSVVSTGILFRQDRKASEFRDWLDGQQKQLIVLPHGSFNGAFRSTGVACQLLVLDKQA